jgi:hypothetical protein
MKTITAALIATLATSTAFAHSYESAFNSPDVAPRNAAPAAAVVTRTAVSLDQLNRGNPDYHSHAAKDGGPRAAGASEICATSLDQFNYGNRDSEFASRKSWERCV